MAQSREELRLPLGRGSFGRIREPKTALALIGHSVVRWVVVASLVLPFKVPVIADEADLFASAFRTGDRTGDGWAHSFILTICRFSGSPIPLPLVNNRLDSPLVSGHCDALFEFLPRLGLLDAFIELGVLRFAKFGFVCDGNGPVTGQEVERGGLHGSRRMGRE